MTDFSDLGELFAFLSGHAPFDGLPDDVRARLAAESSVSEFPEGATILDGLSASPDHAFVVLAGRVGVWNFPAASPTEVGDVDEVVGPGADPPAPPAARDGAVTTTMDALAATPSARIVSAVGPMKVRPASVTAWAKSAFSDRKP